MRASSRKIFKKIGAGLMLGLSLFNLGAAWNKTEGWNTAKRSKKLRVKEKDQIDEEVVVFAEIAEEEAEKAIKERSGFQKEQVVEKIETTLSQKIYRTTAVGLLSVALGVFATSMIFNAPFSLGKGLLSLLPGNPHMAVFSLSSEKEVVNAGDDFTVIARLDSAGEQVDDLKLVINYNPSLVSFEKHNSYINWNVQEKQISDNKRELIFLSDKEKFLPHIFSKEDLTELHFNSKKISANNDLIFSINQNSSIVVSKNKNLNRNLLGRADGLNVHVSDEIIQLMKCQKIEKLDNGVDFWKDFVQGDLANPREDYWRRIDSSTGMICAYDGNDFYLTMVTSSNDKIKNIEIKSDELNQKLDNPYYSWEEKGSNFYLYHSSFDKEVINNLSIIIKNNFIDSRKWPAKGKGRIIFDN